MARRCLRRSPRQRPIATRADGDARACGAVRIREADVSESSATRDPGHSRFGARGHARSPCRRDCDSSRFDSRGNPARGIARIASGRHCDGAYRLRDTSAPSAPALRLRSGCPSRRGRVVVSPLSLSARGRCSETRSGGAIYRHGDDRPEEGARRAEARGSEEESGWRSTVGWGVRWGEVGSAVCGRRSSGADYILELFA